MTISQRLSSRTRLLLNRLSRGGSARRRRSLRFENLETRRLLATITPGDVFEVDSGVPFFTAQSDIAMAPDGSAVAVWQATSADSAFHVYGQRFDSGGSKLGDIFDISGAVFEAKSAQTAIAADGSFVVAYVADGEVYARQYDADGVALAESFMLETDRPSGEDVVKAVDVATDSQGAFVVGWLNGVVNSPSQVHLQRFDATGSAVGGLTRLHADIGIDELDLAMTPDGQLLVAYTQPSYPISNIVGYRFDAAESQIGDSFLINTTNEGSLGGVDIAIGDDGSAIAVWEWDTANVFGHDIYGQRFDTAGGKLGGEFRINSSTKDFQVAPTVAIDGMDNFLVAWDSNHET